WHAPVLVLSFVHGSRPPRRWCRTDLGRAPTGPVTGAIQLTRLTRRPAHSPAPHADAPLARFYFLILLFYFGGLDVDHLRAEVLERLPAPKQPRRHVVWLRSCNEYILTTEHRLEG